MFHVKHFRLPFVGKSYILDIGHLGSTPLFQDGEAAKRFRVPRTTKRGA
jgi:hypothetical protein